MHAILPVGWGRGKQIGAMLVMAMAFGTPAAADPLAELVAGRTAVSPELAGLAVVVADGNGVLRQAGYGRAVIGPGERAMTAATPARVASISKLVVAVAVMRLVEAGTLDLDRDVSAYLGWPLRNPAFPDAPITLRQLLPHTAGVEDGQGYRLPLGKSLRDEMAAAHWANATSGKRFSYANLNYGIVGTVMEAATRERFDRLMTRLVLAPLQLDAGYNWNGASDAAVASAAVLYRKGKDETAWDPAGPWVAQVDEMKGVRLGCPVGTNGGSCELDRYTPGTNGTLFSPQGGLRISALGLAKIGRMLLRGGEVDGVRLLTPASVKTLMTPVWSGGDHGDDYNGLMRAYAPGLQCLTGDADAADQPVPGRVLRWCGHLGEAYGLLGGLWIDRAGGRVYVYLLTGSGDDPAKYPHHSGFMGAEEAILTELVTR